MKTKKSIRSSRSHSSSPRRAPFFSHRPDGGSRPFFQPKLVIGAPGDRFEREADAVADRVVAEGTATPVQRMCGECAEEARDKELRRQPIEEEEEPLQAKAAPELRRQPIEEEEEPVQAKAAPELQRQATEEEEEPVQAKAAPELQRQAMEEEEEVQAKAAPELQPQPIEEEEKPVQARSERDPDPSAGPQLQARLRSTEGGGSPLPSPVLGEMNGAFGRDFGAVRVHTGEPAVQLSQDFGAQAFTRGRDVYFNRGKFAPESHSGRHLLAHELTHVVQQGFAEPADGGLSAPGVQRLVLPPRRITPLTGRMTPAQATTPAQAAARTLSFGQVVHVEVRDGGSISPLTHEYPIDNNGKIKMPVLGLVTAQGMTTTRLARNLQATLSRGFLRFPTVNVTLTSKIVAYGALITYPQVHMRLLDRHGKAEPASGKYPVGSRGTINLPHIGRIRARNRRLDRVEAQVQSAYRGSSTRNATVHLTKQQLR